MEKLKGPDAPPFGSEIEIERPLAVNMIVVASLDEKPISSKRQKQLDILRKFSIINKEDPDIVLPITTSMLPSSSRDNYNKFSYNTHNFVTPIATAEVSEPFPFDLAFAMTVHKAQGRTIKRVVLDLTNHPTHYSRMEFAAIFVAMSRVKTSEHIRLLAHKRVGHQHNADEAYSYITTLKPSRHACAFYYGYPLGHLEEKYGSIWKPSIALKYKSSYT